MKTIGFLFLLALLWAVGLWAFAERAAGSTPAPEPPRSDGVVALTGASNIRVEAAVQLLEENEARRLLISGVNPTSTRAEIRDATHGYTRAFDCCVDLGFSAANTQGNAREIAEWARYHGFATLIVVTADYHMPRSLLELHAAMPSVLLHPYPVVTDTLDARRWWRTPAGARRMIVEYCKYLVILGREAVLKLGGGRRDRFAGPTSPAAPAAATRVAP